MRTWQAASPAQCWANAFAELGEQRCAGDSVLLGRFDPRDAHEMSAVLRRTAAHHARLIVVPDTNNRRFLRRLRAQTHATNTTVLVRGGIGALHDNDPAPRLGIRQVTLASVYGDVAEPELRAIDWSANLFGQKALLALSHPLSRHAMAEVEERILGQQSMKITDERRPPHAGGQLFVIERL